MTKGPKLAIIAVIKIHFMKKVFILVFSLVFLLAFIMGKSIFLNWEEITKDSSKITVTVLSLCVVMAVLGVIVWAFFSQRKIDKEMLVS